MFGAYVAITLPFPLALHSLNHTSSVFLHTRQLCQLCTVSLISWLGRPFSGCDGNVKCLMVLRAASPNRGRVDGLGQVPQ